MIPPVPIEARRPLDERGAVTRAAASLALLLATLAAAGCPAARAPAHADGAAPEVAQSASTATAAPSTPSAPVQKEEPVFSLFGSKKKLSLPTPAEALPGRKVAVRLPPGHFVHRDRPLDRVPPGHEVVYLGMGCFWGAERKYWQQQGVWVTAVGYQGGATENPTYEEVCSGKTGHTEVVRVVFDPAAISIETLLRVFWESHDPTQGMRQGNDVGTQYRSAVYATKPAQREAALASKTLYERRLAEAGYRAVTTEVRDAPPFYFAEEYHQQYLAKNPDGYCGLGGTGVSCPIGLPAAQGAPRDGH